MGNKSNSPYISEVHIKGEQLLMINDEELKDYPHSLIGAITARNKTHNLIKGSGALIS